MCIVFSLDNLDHGPIIWFILSFKIPFIRLLYLEHILSMKLSKKNCNFSFDCRMKTLTYRFMSNIIYSYNQKSGDQLPIFEKKYRWLEYVRFVFDAPCFCIPFASKLRREKTDQFPIQNIIQTIILWRHETVRNHFINQTMVLLLFVSKTNMIRVKTKQKERTKEWMNELRI